MPYLYHWGLQRENKNKFPSKLYTDFPCGIGFCNVKTIRSLQTTRSFQTKRDSLPNLTLGLAQYVLLSNYDMWKKQDQQNNKVFFNPYIRSCCAYYAIGFCDVKATTVFHTFWWVLCTLHYWATSLACRPVQVFRSLNIEEGLDQATQALYMKTPALQPFQTGEFFKTTAGVR